MSRIGVMGEDRSDVATLKVLLRRIAPKIGVDGRAPAAGGCAALRKRLATFMRELAQGGCTTLLILHDLDLSPQNCELNDEAALRARLSEAAVPAGVERLICIPVEELEAWF